MSNDFQSTVNGAQQIKDAAEDIKEKEETIAVAANTQETAKDETVVNIAKDETLVEVSLEPLADGERRPTPEELKTLRRVPDSFNWKILSIAFIELCERFSFYGASQVMPNFIQHPLPEGSFNGGIGGLGDPDLQPGALGLGQRASTGLNTFNSFWNYTAPLFGAYIADAWLGRYWTISWALYIDILGHVLLTCSALPALLMRKATSTSLGLFVPGLVLMGGGTGGFKPNVSSSRNPSPQSALTITRSTHL